MDTAVTAASSLLTSSCAGLHESVDGDADCWACILSTAPWGWPPYCTDSPSAEPRREDRFRAPAGGLAVYTNTRPAPVLSLFLSPKHASWPLFSLARDILRDADGNNSVPAFLHPGVYHPICPLCSHSDHIYSCVTEIIYLWIYLCLRGQPLCVCASLTLATFQYAIRIVYCRFWICSLVQSILPHSIKSNFF
jgi:hypothetical protein